MYLQCEKEIYEDLLAQQLFEEEVQQLESTKETLNAKIILGQSRKKDSFVQHATILTNERKLPRFLKIRI